MRWVSSTHSDSCSAWRTLRAASTCRQPSMEERAARSSSLWASSLLSAGCVTPADRRPARSSRPTAPRSASAGAATSAGAGGCCSRVSMALVHLSASSCTASASVSIRSDRQTTCQSPLGLTDNMSISTGLTDNMSVSTGSDRQTCQPPSGLTDRQHVSLHWVCQTDNMSVSIRSDRQTTCQSPSGLTDNMSVSTGSDRQTTCQSPSGMADRQHVSLHWV